MKVCIVTSGCLSSGPRVVKEADALSGAGYDVCVVTSQTMDWMEASDRRLAQGKAWTYSALRWDGGTTGSRWLRTYSGVRQMLCGSLRRLNPTGFGLVNRVVNRVFSEQRRAVMDQRADLYIAHNLAALPVAACAARARGVMYAFDAEDDHLGELSQTQQASWAADLIRRIESKYLPSCAYITAASDGIADELASRYSIPRPTPIYNVFPWSDRKKLDGRLLDRRGRRVSLYWYSQVIGLDRGLQDLLRAASRLKGDFEIHLRGHCDPQVSNELLGLAHQGGVADRLYFHEPVHPDELLSRTAEHDIGLALEQPVNRNKLITCSNKLFFYLLAGLAVAATDTAGQRSVMPSCSGAGFLYPPGDFESLAAQLQPLIDSPGLLQKTKAAALISAKNRWNWESEGEKLMAPVRQVLGDLRRKKLVPCTSS